MHAHQLTTSVLGLMVAAILTSGCQGGRSDTQHVRVAGGDPQRGAGVIRHIGCGACHTIPGIDGARGVVGPPLSFWSRRSYIAGNLPNSPPNLVRWIRDADAVEPGTAMPDLGLSEQQARDVAAYLYTLD
jgi:cytochrome c